MNLIKSKITKKIFAGILPATFLFVTMFPLNLTHAAAPTTVYVLPEGSDSTLTTITDGQSRDYSTGGGHKDSTGAAGAGRGTISYSTAGGTGVLTLNSVDLTTINGLISADGGNGDLEIVLNGTNSITSSGDTISATSNNIRFSGPGTLTISQNTTNSAISTTTAGNVDFASDSDITLNQAADESAINSAGNLTMTKGTVNVNQTGAAKAVTVTGTTTVNDGTLNIVQNTDNNGLDSTGAITLTGGTVNSTINNANSTGIPVYSASTVTTTNTNVKAIGAAGSSPYGVSNAVGQAITINKGSNIEAVGNTNAIRPENLAIDDTVDWAAIVGQSADTAQRLPQVKGTEIVNALKTGGQDYVRLYNESTIDPTSATFDKNTLSKDHTEITVGLGLNGNALTEIVAAGTPLRVGSDYVLNYNGTDPVSVTFQVREYLEKLPVGTHVLTFRFNNNANVDFTLNVIDSAAADDLPKTGDNTTIMPYVLLLTAGIFTIVIASKKKIFNK